MNKESNVSPKTSNDCSLHLPRVREMDWALTMICEDLFVTLLGPKLGPDVFTCDESGVCSS